MQRSKDSVVDDLIRVADMPSRQLLRSARTHPLMAVPRVRRATRQPNIPCGRLPSDVVDCQTVDTFRRRLKHFFLMCLFLDISIVLVCFVYFPMDLEVFYLGHVKNLCTIQYNTIQFDWLSYNVMIDIFLSYCHLCF